MSFLKRVSAWRWSAPAFVVVILLLAAGLRFHLLGEQSLWHDEGNSYVQSTRAIGEIAAHAARDIHPPGYYWLLAGWRLLAGESEFALRALSAFASILSVAFTYALGVRLAGRLAGVMAALFVALNTFSIYYAQEARMYALLALLGAAAMWAFVDFVRSVSSDGQSIRRWGIALALLNAAGLYTHYAFAFVLLAQGILLLVWVGADMLNRRTWTGYTLPLRYYVVVNVATLALFLPWLPTAWAQITTWPTTGEAVPFAEAASTILAYMAFGVTVGAGTTASAAFFLLFGLLYLPDERRVKSWWYALMPPVWVLVAVGVFLALELFREANLKFLLPAQIAFALWMGRGIRVLWGMRPRREIPVLKLVPRLAAALGGLALITTLWGGLDALYSGDAYQRDDYRAIAASIIADYRPGDAIILNGPGQQEVFGYYYAGDAPVYPLPRGLGGDAAATLEETRAIIDAHRHIYAVYWGTGERDPANVVESALATEAYEAYSTWYGSVRLVRYAAPVEFAEVYDSGARFGDSITLEEYALSAESIAAGDALRIRLTWSADAPLAGRYVVFVQLLNPDGFLAVQRDSQPGAGQHPTTAWQPGEEVIDHHALIMPHDLPAAHYLLIIGLYNPDDPQARLPVIDLATSATLDHLALAVISVTVQQEAER
jgi:mannosyltransferase